MQSGYQIPDPLPWAQLAGPLAAAEDALARLDERLAKSPIREGWIARTHFTDACASLWLDGELVHLEDLVLHDAGMDIRAPTHELTRAHAVLRARRRIAEAKPDWALSAAGLAGLRGRGGRATGRRGRAPEGRRGTAMGARMMTGTGTQRISKSRSASSRPILSSPPPSPRSTPRTPGRSARSPPRLGRGRSGIRSSTIPTGTRTAVSTTGAPWSTRPAACRRPWRRRSPPTPGVRSNRSSTRLGSAACSQLALLRDRGKTRWHLPCLHAGLKSIPRERRRPRDAAARLAVQLEAMTAAAEAGLKDHDRWLMTRNLLARKLDGRRATSKLPALLDYVLTRPIVSAGMIAAELKITPRAAQNLVAELGLREATGRGRYRAWGIL